MVREMPRLVLLLILVTTVSIGHADPPLTIKAQAVWNGLTKAGTTTEIAISLLADRNGEVEVSLPDHEPRLRVTAVLNALQPYTLWLTVRPTAGRVLRVDAQMQGGDASTGTAVRFEDAPEDANLVASTMILPADRVTSDAHPIPVLLNPAVSMLPHTSGGYGSITAVILDSHELVRLEERQLESLQDYSAACGHIVLVGNATPRSEALIGTAGCGGRYIARVTGRESALMTAQGMQNGIAPALPSANRLQPMQNTDVLVATRAALVVFFILYATGMLLFARESRRVAPLLGVPVLAALLSWMAWSNDKVGRSLISWSEIDTHGHMLRYSALLKITGNGKGDARTLLPAGFGLFWPQTKNSTAELVRYDSDAEPAVLRSRGYLLSQDAFFTRGTMRFEPPVTISMTDQGPVIENRSSEVSPPALLGWNDQHNPVPALRPGERWSPPEHGTPWNVVNIEEQLLRERAQAGMAALLVPHRLLPADKDALLRIDERGWLLIVSS